MSPAPGEPSSPAAATPLAANGLRESNIVDVDRLERRYRLAYPLHVFLENARQVVVVFAVGLTIAASVIFLRYSLSSAGEAPVEPQIFLVTAFASVVAAGQGFQREAQQAPKQPLSDPADHNAKDEEGEKEEESVGELDRLRRKAAIVGTASFADKRNLINRSVQSERQHGHNRKAERTEQRKHDN